MPACLRACPPARPSCVARLLACSWLGLVAFHRVLSRKPAAFRGAMACLEAALAQPLYRHLPAQLGHVVCSERSAVFDDMAY